MHRHAFLALAALAASSAAQAQTATPPPKAPAIPNAHPAASVNPPTTAGLTPGMPVRDSNGVTIGTIKQLGQNAAGRPIADLEIDGRQVRVPAGWLNRTTDGTRAVSTLTKAQILAAAPKTAG
jgi:hypothetical protein